MANIERKDSNTFLRIRWSINDHLIFGILVQESFHIIGLPILNHGHANAFQVENQATLDNLDDARGARVLPCHDILGVDFFILVDKVNCSSSAMRGTLLDIVQFAVHDKHARGSRAAQELMRGDVQSIDQALSILISQREIDGHIGANGRIVVKRISSEVFRYLGDLDHIGQDTRNVGTSGEAHYDLSVLVQPQQIFQLFNVDMSITAYLHLYQLAELVSPGDHVGVVFVRPDHHQG